MLTEAQKQQYQRDGYIVLPGFKSLDQIAAPVSYTHLTLPTSDLV